MLQGWVPGMSVINKTGKVGGSPKIRIRGTSTLLGNQEPLWVVDGVIQSDPLPIPDDANPLSSEMDGLRETASNAISWLNPADRVERCLCHGNLRDKGNQRSYRDYD